ncbi:Metallo-dependent phosphatase-like protein [Pelagophyceae sp. CCMP2097]|nr:Metallo-dependent phosphatase-like protein [Pelagophyceae sp. CCMP2097]|mmetsp:Transcript_26579/g.89424  ORF Transcript_26579/g.89424 Transcript_26579/m.89424 type:complete len:451 (+) Transcript_26579:88-1440(+)
MSKARNDESEKKSMLPMEVSAPTPGANRPGANRPAARRASFINDIDLSAERDLILGMRREVAVQLFTITLIAGLLFWAVVATVAASKAGRGAVAAAASAFRPPPPRNTDIHRVAFGSCNQQRWPQPGFDAVSTLAPDLLVLAGDNVYGDCKSDGCPELPEAYAEMASKPSFQGLLRTTPIVAIWDDHDAGQNDGGAANPWLAFAKQHFLDFFEVPSDDARRKRAGLYTSYTFGATPEATTQVILLDARSFKSEFDPTDERYAPYKERYLPSLNESRTMLGAAQWKWLESELAEPAALRLIVSSIQIVADGHGWECWRMFPLERDRLYSLLKKRAGGAVVVLSGDRHSGAFYKYEDGDLVVTEITSSSWTHTSPQGFAACVDSTLPETCDEPGPNRIGAMVRANNFGTVDVDWTSRTATLALRHTETTDWSGANWPAADPAKIIAAVEVQM